MPLKKNLIILLSLSLFLLNSIIAQQDSSRKELFIMEIKSQIDARSNRYVELALEEARKRNSEHIIIEMNTYGGALNDADEIRSMLMAFEKPIYVYINNNAASAGALISIACDSIYMSPGASIGAATVVNQTGEAAPDKYQSYMRSIMRSTAEASGRDPKIAEAMVDENLEVEGISEAGEVITFSTSEAIKYDFCEGEYRTLDAMIQDLGLDGYERHEFEKGAVEEIIAFFINPFVSGILIMIILGGIYFELQTPGVGFPIAASVLALIFYLVPYYLHGLTENWEVLVFVIGIILIAVEIFAIPGFGVFGILGIIGTIGGLVLMMINNDGFDFTFTPSDEIIQSLGTTLAGLLGGVIIMILGGVRLTNSQFFKRIALQDTQERASGYSSRFIAEGFMGKKGTVYSVLRPSGKVEIEGEIYDAYTRGEYLDAGTTVEVIEESGTSLRVKKSEK